MAYGYYIEAEYSDGYVLSETSTDDVSPYDEGRNVFHAIVNFRPVAEHGSMVRWSLIPDGDHEIRLDVDWRDIPPGARPIYWREMRCSLVGRVAGPPEALQHHFGYQYPDKQGRCVKEILDVT
jgi:hypothetical protein